MSNVFGNGTLLVSDIPKSSASGKGIVLGIDEAGRGCVLGPMVYGLAYWSADEEELTQPIPKGFNDSKQLSDDTRRSLFRQLVDHPDIGFIMRSFLPSEISRNMLRSEPYNLNQMSHDAAFCMIRKLLNAGVKIEKCFIDTVGNAQSYQRRLEQAFPNVEFTVESKADAKYAACSAASVGEFHKVYPTTSSLHIV
jgi:ribonuclease H2 subunit A